VRVANTLIDLLLFSVLVAPLGILAANVVSTSAGITNLLLYRCLVWPSSTGSGAEAGGACAGAATEQLAARHERTASRGRIERAHG
jgi:hypothetical protein